MATLLPTHRAGSLFPFASDTDPSVPLGMPVTRYLQRYSLSIKGTAKFLFPTISPSFGKAAILVSCGTSILAHVHQGTTSEETKMPQEGPGAGVGWSVVTGALV